MKNDIEIPAPTDAEPQPRVAAPVAPRAGLRVRSGIRAGRAADRSTTKPSY